MGRTPVEPSIPSEHIKKKGIITSPILRTAYNIPFITSQNGFLFVCVCMQCYITDSTVIHISTDIFQQCCCVGWQFCQILILYILKMDATFCPLIQLITFTLHSPHPKFADLSNFFVHSFENCRINNFKSSWLQSYLCLQDRLWVTFFSVLVLLLTLF